MDLLDFLKWIIIFALICFGVIITFVFLLLCVASVHLFYRGPGFHPKVRKQLRYIDDVSNVLSARYYGQREGFRYAYLVTKVKGMNTGEVKFASIARQCVFGVTSRATCALWSRFDEGPPHEAPVKSCSCGFYSRKTALGLAKATKLMVDCRYGAVLKVQVSGQCIPATDGYRAQRQDVLAAWLQSRCSKCKEHAVCFVPCETVRISTLLPKNYMALAPMCDKHAAGKIRHTIEYIRERLQTDINWLPFNPAKINS